MIVSEEIRNDAKDFFAVLKKQSGFSNARTIVKFVRELEEKLSMENKNNNLFDRFDEASGIEEKPKDLRTEVQTITMSVFETAKKAFIKAPTKESEYSGKEGGPGEGYKSGS